MKQTSFSIHEAAELAGITVRTLHHYDAIGLLQPARSSAKAYRMYSFEDMERLQEILILKELQFTLSDIRELINNREKSRLEALSAQKQLLIEKQKRLTTILNTLDKTIERLQTHQGEECTMNTEESLHDMFDGFSMEEIEEHQKKYREETQAAYGNTGAYAESTRRTASYTKADWKNIQAEAHSIYTQLQKLMNLSPGAPEVQACVALWQEHITTHYYPCTREILKGLGEIYSSDSRFSKNIDKTAPGLAQFLSDAILIYTT